MISKILSIARCQKPTFRNFYNFSQKRLTFLTQETIAKREYIRKRSTYLNIALCSFVFAICFAGIPLYRTFCQHMGLVGDSQKKQYTFTGKKINNLKKFKVSFSGQSAPNVQWQFQPVEKQVIISAGETAIVFYRLYNKEQKPIVGFSTYNISPQDCNVYFSKIQCFCFNQQLINPKQELLLPIFFYLEPQINENPDVCRVENIKVAYSFIKSAKQNLAKFAEEQLKRVQQNKHKLNQIRAKKMNMTVDQYVQFLDAQQTKLQQQNQALRDKELKTNFQIQELQNQKYKKDFEEDLIKAELISKQFEIDNEVSENKPKAQSIS